MAKKVAGFIKLQIPAGKATPAPPVGPALGQHGVNIMGFCKEFKNQDAGFERCIAGSRDEHGCGDGPQHGRHRRRLSARKWEQATAL